MIRPILFAAVLLTAPVLAQTAPPPITLSINAEGKVDRVPDVADMSAGVMTTAPTATEAMRLNAIRMAGVIAALKRAGIADRDVQTSGLNLQPQYRYAQNEEPKLTGYQANNMVNVRVRDLANMGRSIDALVASGANQINGPNFRLDEPGPALDAARVEAVGKARQRAELYARASGLRIKRILAISEGGASSPPYPMPMLRAQMAMSEKADTAIAPGEVSMTVSVNMMFELE